MPENMQNIQTPFGFDAIYYSEPNSNHPGMCLIDLSRHRVGRLYLSESLWTEFQSAIPDGTGEVGQYPTALTVDDQAISLRERPKIWNLVRSKMWRLWNPPTALSSRSLYLVTGSEKRDSEQHPEQRPAWQKLPLVSLDEIWREMRNLTTREKALKTLENYDAYCKVEGISTFVWPGIRGGESGEIHFEPAQTNLKALNYGADKWEATAIFRYLVDSGWVRVLITPASTATGLRTPSYEFAVSGSGYDQLDAIRKGRSEASKTAFFVRKWDQGKDAFFLAVREIVEQKTGVSIRAIWDYPHNERIDDLILRKIRECVAVVVEIDPKNFNVGLETGYAIARDKTVIAIRPRTSRPQKIPFDVVTLNCYTYDPADAERLAAVLAERIEVAVERNLVSNL